MAFNSSTHHGVMKRSLLNTSKLYHIERSAEQRLHDVESEKKIAIDS